MPLWTLGCVSTALSSYGCLLTISKADDQGSVLSESAKLPDSMKVSKDVESSAVAEVSAESRAEERALPSKDEIAGVRAAVNAAFDEDEALATAIIGMAWDMSGAYDISKQVGGSDDGARVLRVLELFKSSETEYETMSRACGLLQTVTHLFPVMSPADALTLAAAAAVEHLGGPYVPWRPGRNSDAGSNNAATRDVGIVKTIGTGDGVDSSNLAPLPTAETLSCAVGDTVKTVRAIFHRQGFNDRETVALMGGFAVFSNYPNRTQPCESKDTMIWTVAPSTFANDYFRDLMSNTWTLKPTQGTEQFENSNGSLVMFPSDMALLWDKSFRKHVAEFAADEDSFFREFAAAFQKLEENGVRAFGRASTKKPWYQFW